MNLPTVLIVAPITGENFSGLTYSVPSTARALHNIGVPVSLLTTASDKAYINKEIFPVYYYKNEEGKKITLKDLPKPFNKPDIIVFQSTYIPYHAKLAKEAVKYNIPYVITPRGGMTLRAQKSKSLKKKLGNLLFFNNMVRKSSKIHCLTLKEADDVKKWNDNIFIIPNGIDIPLEESLCNDRNTEVINFTFIGRLDINHKGLDLLIEAASLIKHKLENVKIRIYGPAVQASDLKLREMITQYKLDETVTVLGPVRGENKSEILKKTDIFIHTSRFEGHPMAVLEALSYGIPCLLTPGTNISKQISDIGGGWEAQETPEGIASVLEDILQNKENFRKMGLKGRTMVNEYYKWENIAIKLIEEYKSILVNK
ncbi:glycosyltransferase family 4 protein [Priestia megaterium]|uniref:glycosyltransferase family 4 protein n=1 Tax=Priestia megaterium TaxID=1404 RepID=UPI0021D64F57|nr:glycosyltransferase family 4 protein [Priestia megaterium]MCU7740179.1 glycosyltransferase family 4 protein [Priestia megaterium]